MKMQMIVQDLFINKSHVKCILCLSGRFPCCGKAYPCDKCHDENEVDHEMKFANRMICGFCAKEQVC